MEPVTTTASQAEITADRSLDCSGLICPLPAYKAALALKGLAPGEILELICTDPASLEDIPALARQGGHELLRSADEDGSQRFWLRRGEAR